LLREVLGVSDHWRYRARAIDALEEWGESTTGLFRGDPRHSNEVFSDEPPF
jgi:hypothetical protein